MYQRLFHYRNSCLQNWWHKHEHNKLCDILVLKGLGVTKLRGSGRGDLLVHIDIQTPTKLNAEQEKYINEFIKSRKEDVAKIKVNLVNDIAHDEQNDGKGFFNRVRDAFR